MSWERTRRGQQPSSRQKDQKEFSPHATSDEEPDSGGYEEDAQGDGGHLEVEAVPSMAGGPGSEPISYYEFNDKAGKCLLSTTRFQDPQKKTESVEAAGSSASSSTIFHTPGATAHQTTLGSLTPQKDKEAKPSVVVHEAGRDPQDVVEEEAGRDQQDGR